MERLTARDPAGNAYFPECFKEPCGGGGCTKDHCEFFDQVCDKLAGYEEQGKQAEKLLAESEAARADLGKRLAEAQRELAEIKAERDAAVADLRKYLSCGVCSNGKCYIRNGTELCNFKYRGQRKEA